MLRAHSALVVILRIAAQLDSLALELIHLGRYTFSQKDRRVEKELLPLSHSRMRAHRGQGEGGTHQFGRPVDAVV